VEVPVSVAVGLSSANLTSLLEEDGDALAIDGNMVRVPVGTRAVQSVRLRFNPR